MSKEPRHRNFGTPLSQWLREMPNEMKDISVHFGLLVSWGRQSFGQEGEALVDFLRSNIRALLDAGGLPVDFETDHWAVQPQYGSSKEEIIESVIAEWQAQGSPMPEPWTGVAFALRSDNRYSGWQ